MMNLCSGSPLVVCGSDDRVANNADDNLGSASPLDPSLFFVTRSLWKPLTPFFFAPAPCRAPFVQNTPLSLKLTTPKLSPTFAGQVRHSTPSSMI